MSKNHQTPVVSLTSADIKKIQKNEDNEDLAESEALLEVDEPVEKIVAKPIKTTVKRERTEKQKEIFEKARLTRLANIELKKQLKEQEELEARKKKEELIVKKAVAIKKKEIKERAILEEISDDDTPVEKIKEIKKKMEIKQNIKATQSEPPKVLSFYEKYKFV